MKQFMIRDPVLEKEKHERIGMTNYNNAGSFMEVQQYRSSYDIDVMMITVQTCGNINYYMKDNTYFKYFKGPKMSSPYDRSISGVGYIGEGIYNPTNNIKIYSNWRHMISRCYNNNYKLKYPFYKEVYSHPYFHNFQNFGDWYKCNYYEFEGEQMCLDKDILFKNNKMYGPDTCVYVPERINLLFVKCNKTRGNLHIGVWYNDKNKKYEAQLSLNEKRCTDKFNTPEEAFYFYKINKENYIKEIANYYMYQKGGQYIPQFKKVYNAMINYKVEISD